LGIGGACTARVGQYLGANEPLGALTACRVAFCVQMVISVICAGGSYGLKEYIPMLFTNDDDTISYTAHLIPILALFLLLEGIGGIVVSVVRGTGRQTLGGVVVFVSYYVFALPIGIPLMFCTSLGQAGLWWGYVIGIGLEDLFLCVFLSRMDWDKEAHLAQVRAGTTQTDPQSENIRQQEPDERTSLLSQNDEEENITDGPFVRISGSSSSRKLLVLKRLSLLFAFCLFPIIGLLVRMYVDIEPHEKWTSLCLVPETFDFTADAGNLTTVIPDVTLPFCNETVYEPMIHHLYIP